MPLYGFKCDSCGHADLEYGQMKDAVSIGSFKQCSKCGANTFKRLPDRVATDLQDFAIPIEMLSVGCSTIEEIREIQHKCPGVKISDDPDDPNWGVPIAANRRQKLDILKATGFVERN